MKPSNCIFSIGSLERVGSELRAWTRSDNSALLEVETLVERSADRALEDVPSVVDHRSNLVQSIVKALETDPKWIPLYNITGRLEAPPIPDLEPELEPVVSRIKKVSSSFTSKMGY